MSSACSTKPTDLRSLVPAETLVFLETDDLAAVLQPIVDSKPFNEVAKRKPDFSALKGVQLAVAVTGFETTEVELTDEHSVGKVQPRFVAVADTHAWNYQAVGFAEKKLGSFVADIYGSEPKLEQIDKNGGKYFTWTSKDGRKAFALVVDSLIYFGNDETSIEKCLAVKRGEGDSISKTGKLPQRVPGTLALGYVSTDGIAQIANIAGLQFASQSSDNSEIQSAIAGILPQLIRGTVTDVTWVMSRNDRGVEDKYLIGESAEVGPVFTETFAHASQIETELFRFVPAAIPSITFYNLKKPNIAWRSLLLTAQSRTDRFGSVIIGEFSGAFAEPYGIRDPELFLNGVGTSLATIRIDSEGEKPAVIATVTNNAAVRASLSAELKPDTAMSETTGVEVLRSGEGDLAAFFNGDKLVVGDADTVSACLNAGKDENFLLRNPSLVMLFSPNATSITFGTDTDVASAVANVLAEKKSDNSQANSLFVSETRFIRSVIERRTVSDFGFVGWLIAQLSAE